MVAAVEKVAFVGERGLPWWNGQQGTEGVNLDRLQTAAEMVVASGLNWNVVKNPVWTEFEGRNIQSADKVATVRDSDGAWLGTVGPNYQVVQNAEAFGFADNLVDDGQAKYETAGSLRGGRLVFLSMELNHLDLTLDGEHPDGVIKTYLLLSNTHDGSRSLEADITKVRVVCQNTLNVAIAGAQRRFRIRHSGSIDGKLAAAREALGIAFNYDAAFEKAAKALLAKKVTDAQVRKILSTVVWPLDPEASEGRVESHPSTLAFEDYMKSDNLDPIRGTAWGALNAVAEFIDHEQEYRGRKDAAMDVRSNSILWGTGQAKKQAAFQALMKVR